MPIHIGGLPESYNESDLLMNGQFQNNSPDNFKKQVHESEMQSSANAMTTMVETMHFGGGLNDHSVGQRQEVVQSGRDLIFHSIKEQLERME